MQTEVLDRRELIKKSTLLVAGLAVSHPDIVLLEAISSLQELQSSEHPYYTQFRTIETEHGPIIFEANSIVNPAALETAKTELLNITGYRDDLIPNLARRRFKVAILPQRAPLNSIPQFSSLTINTSGYANWSEGGIVVVISEGNLLGRLTGNELEDWTTRMRFSIAFHEYGHAILIGGINDTERTHWITQLYPRLKSGNEFPRIWRNLFPNTFEAFAKHSEMFAELTRGIKQGIGPQIRILDDAAADYFSEILGPF